MTAPVLVCLYVFVFTSARSGRAVPAGRHCRDCVSVINAVV